MVMEPTYETAGGIISYRSLFFPFSLLPSYLFLEAVLWNKEQNSFEWLYNISFI
jgi:hypothetical protein